MYRANGTQINKTTAATLVTNVPVTDPLVKVSERIYEGVRAEGSNFPNVRRRLKFVAGQVIRLSELNACFPAPTIISVSPAAGPAAGNTLVTIKCANATPGATVTFGGTAATSITVINETTITCRTPAKAVGAADVVVTNDSAAATATGGFTYA
ncbi:IPT/TIG domain-containing protein [Nonomuraea sp. NPDC050547]|uniref:IPT/TIG domain-containing protein n=1 Tax=Nonomuraea sp. NPDC050547 TaxID=3364368 RepID=UPI0037AFA5D5